MVEDVINFGWYDVARVRDRDVPTVQELDSVSLVSTVSTEWFFDRFRHFKDKFLVARKHDTGEIIGYLSASHNMYYPEQLPGYVYIARFAVKCNYRRCGIGTALLTTLYEHLLESKEYRGVVADVRKSNTISLKFFTGKHCFLEHSELSRPKWYEKGETEEDKYKIVIYKSFRMDDI